MKKLFALVCAVVFSFSPGRAAESQEMFQDRFVWVFGWNLGSDKNVSEIARVLQAAGKGRLNGAIASFGLDTLCKQPPEYFARLATVQEICRTNGLEFIPAVFSIGYGGGVLSHDRNLAEGLPVQDAPFLVRGGTAELASGQQALLANGGFEEFTGQRLKSFNFHDQPGEISFVDREIKHSGNAALRLENFTANQHGHARVMQTVKVQPHRCYRVTFWARSDDLQPASAFRAVVLANNHELAPRQFRIDSTSDWKKFTFLFNSMEHQQVNVYAGLWGGKSGKLWLDDWSVEEVGPVNVLRRSGTPVTVRSEDGTTTYEEGKDFAPLRHEQLQPYGDDKEALSLNLLPGGRIRDGQRLKVSWYHSMVINESQVTVCMGEPAVYDILEHEARLLAEKVRPQAVMLNMDEVRMGGTCRACAGRDMGQLVGECVSRQASALRRHTPGLRIYVWSDMFDPHHNARDNYYLVKGSYVGSWSHIPKDLIIAVWGGEPREKNLKFFADQGFQTLAACYYDADDLEEVKGWITLARQTRNVRGLMYTPWLKKYDLLPEFSRLLAR